MAKDKHVKTKKRTMINKIKPKTIIKRNLDPTLGDTDFPSYNTLTTFRISDENIRSFNRIIMSPMDCFINALQIIGILDQRTADIIRISTSGMVGFNEKQIELIFMYTLKKNFHFKKYYLYATWLSEITQNMRPGTCVFAGYRMIDGAGHVFLIARRLDGIIVYIDPQLNTICDINEQECRANLMNKKFYFLLYNSSRFLTERQNLKVARYITKMQKNVVAPPPARAAPPPPAPESPNSEDDL